MINRRSSIDMSTPWWFKVWFALCAVVGLAFAGFIVWALYSVVTWITAQ